MLGIVGDARKRKKKKQEEEEEEEEETVSSSKYGSEGRWHNSPRNKSPEGLGAKGAGFGRKVRQDKANQARSSV